MTDRGGIHACSIAAGVCQKTENQPPMRQAEMCQAYGHNNERMPLLDTRRVQSSGQPCALEIRFSQLHKLHRLIRCRGRGARKPLVLYTACRVGFAWTIMLVQIATA